MAPLKAPGIDGFHAKFYQAQWDIVGPSVYTLVRWVMEECPLDPRINRTLLVLLLKIQGPERITQFRPISLCTVLNKKIMKTIINSLRPLMVKLIEQNQANFVMVRNITKINDNVSDKTKIFIV